MQCMSALTWRNLKEVAIHCVKSNRPLMLRKNEIPLFGRLFCEGLVPVTGNLTRVEAQYSPHAYVRIPIPHFVWLDGSPCGFNKKGLEFMRIHSFATGRDIINSFTRSGEINAAYAADEVWEILDFILVASEYSKLGVSLDCKFLADDPDTGIYRLALWAVDNEYYPRREYLDTGFRESTKTLEGALISYRSKEHAPEVSS